MNYSYFIDNWLVGVLIDSFHDILSYETLPFESVSYLWIVSGWYTVCVTIRVLYVTTYFGPYKRLEFPECHSILSICKFSRVVPVTCSTLVCRPLGADQMASPFWRDLIHRKFHSDSLTHPFFFYPYLTSSKFTKFSLLKTFLWEVYPSLPTSLLGLSRRPRSKKDTVIRCDYGLWRKRNLWGTSTVEEILRRGRGRFILTGKVDTVSDRCTSSLGQSL